MLIIKGEYRGPPIFVAHRLSQEDDEDDEDSKEDEDAADGDGHHR